MAVSKAKKNRSNNPYVAVYQNEHINELGFLSPNSFKGGEKEIKENIDKETGKFVLRNDSTCIYFDPSNINTKIRIQQILMYYIEQFAKKVFKGAPKEVALENKTLKLNIADVAAEFNITTVQARAIVIEASLALMSMCIGWSEKTEKREIFCVYNLLQDFQYNGYNTESEDFKRGEFEVVFGDKFATNLPKLYILWYPRNVRKISVKDHPNSNSFALKIALEHKMHPGRPINTLTLLNRTKEIPSIETVMSGARQVYKRIIFPFIRDMDALVEANVLTDWKLFYDGEEVPRTEYRKLRYDDFCKCNVFFSMPPNPNLKKNKEQEDLLAS